MLTVRVTGLPSVRALITSLRTIQGRAANGQALHSDAGWYMRNRMKHGMENFGYPAVRPWPRSYRLSGRPLVHKRRLLNSISYAATANLAVAGTMDPAAAIHDNPSRTLQTSKNRGYLAIPLSPPLSPSEAEAYRTARVPDGFVIYGKSGNGKPRAGRDASGYEGPGVYRKRGKLIQRVKAFVKQVRTTQRSITSFPMRFLHVVPERWIEFIMTGKFQQGTGAGLKPATEGNPIVRR